MYTQPRARGRGIAKALLRRIEDEARGANKSVLAVLWIDHSVVISGRDPMCNDFGNHIPYSDYLAAFSQTLIPVKWPNAAPNLEPRDDI
jgi:GNAT superfamily N-acetyltransferase